MDALPTPYDIASIPGIPFTPSMLLWLIVIGLLLIPFVIVALTSRNPSRRPPALRRLTVQQLRKLLSGSSARQTASEAALALKRFLAAHYGISVEALTGEELVRMGGQESSELVRALTPLIGELDQARFSAGADPSRIYTLIEQAASLLSQEELK